jgi:prepilin-type N-terminal cleavage/methylation domain-containing protein
VFSEKREAARRLRPRGFTLMELVVVLVITSIMVALVLPGFSLFKERAIDKEALAGIKVIVAAERQYYARYGSWTNNINNIAQLNTLLSTNLNETNWAYTIQVNNPHGVRIRARRTVGGTRTWEWDTDSFVNDTPSCNGGGCP